MLVRLESPTGETRTAKIGFSWTTFFFGFLVPICRGDAKWAVIMVAAAILTWWVAIVVLAFTYNGTYIRGLLAQGFVPADDESREALIKKGFIA